MKILTGTVTHGRIIVEGESLPDGEKVTILTREGNETFRVSAEEKALLLQSLDQSRRGEFVDTDELLAEIDQAN